MEAPTIETYEFLEQFELWLTQVGISTGMAQPLKVAVSLGGIAILAFLANFIAKKVIVVAISYFAQRTKSEWDDYLVNRKVFHKLSHLAPALVIYATIGIALYDYKPEFYFFIQKLTNVYIVVALLLVLTSFVNALHDMYLTLSIAKSRPVKGYVQVVKIIFTVLAIIISIAILIEQNPLKLLLGMGASAAILMLVFKDTILGLVASVQVSANNMVKPGDWIEMPSRNADGTVLEITLNTVKVQNWDCTISTIPTYALVSESFTNWKGMQEGEGRRIKRSILIDLRSVKFCSPELLDSLRRIHLVREYIDQRAKEIEEYNKAMGFDTSMPVNGRRMTNLGIFRRYVEHYLKNNPNVNTNMTLMVRQRQPTDTGIPIEVYCFSTHKALVEFEGVQSDIFDHILAIVPFFELKVFQSPSGEDFQNLAKN